jgi:hypothetical protein
MDTYPELLGDEEVWPCPVCGTFELCDCKQELAAEAWANRCGQVMPEYSDDETPF